MLRLSDIYFAGFEPALFCLDPVPPCWIKNTLHLWPSHWVPGSTLWFHHTLMLSTHFCVHHSASLQVSLLSVWITGYLTFCFLFQSGAPCEQFTTNWLLSTWTDEGRLMKPTWYVPKLFLLTHVALPFSLLHRSQFVFLQLASSESCHFATHLVVCSVGNLCLHLPFKSISGI